MTLEELKDKSEATELEFLNALDALMKAEQRFEVAKLVYLMDQRAYLLAKRKPETTNG